MKNIFIACYHVNEEKTHTKKVMKERYDDSPNFPHGVCTTKISFNDEDLLLGSKLYNWPLFIKWYVNEKMVNCILMDDDSAVNILPLKTIKKSSGFLWMNSFQIIWWFKALINEGKKAIRKIRLAIYMEDMESNALLHVIDVKTTYNMLLRWPMSI